MKSLMAAVQLGAVLAGQCTDSDYQFWASYGRTFSNFLTGCAKKEWGNAEKTSQCLLDDPMNKLSGSCATCFGDFQGCAKSECWFECFWDATSNRCLNCINGSKCPGELSTCTGYAVADLPPNPSTSIKSLPTTTMPPTTSTTTTTTTTTMTTTSPSMSTYPPTTTESSSISSTSPIVTTTVIHYGKCTSADHMLWTSYGQAYSNYIAYCGQQAWGSADGTSKCLEKSGLTSSCSTCFGDSVQCGRDKCMFSCISGPATSECLSCIAKTECNPALYKCTGYQAVDMPPSPTGTGRLPETTSTPITSPTATASSSTSMTETTTMQPTTSATTTTTTMKPTTRATTTTTTMKPTTSATTTTTTMKPTTSATTTATTMKSTPSATTTATTMKPTTSATLTTTVTTMEPTTIACRGTTVESTTTTKATTTTQPPYTQAANTVIETTAEPSTKTTVESNTTHTSTTTISSFVVKTTPSFVSCPGADGKCSSILHGSYCKYWMVDPVCHGTHQPCSCSTPSFSTIAESTPRLTCDAACSSEHPGSYCKCWQVPHVCFATDTPCFC